MNANLQAMINPFSNDKPGSTPSVPASSSTPQLVDEERTDFRDLLTNSNAEIKQEREAKISGNGFTGKETEAEFLEKLADSTRPKREIKNKLDKDDFLRLFVTQLQHQDPLNPDDGSEMAARLAQFDSLEQMLNMNKTLEKMVEEQKINRGAELVNYIGKEMEVDGGRLRVKDGLAVGKLHFDIKIPATQTMLSIKDSAGVVVRETEIGPLNAGSHNLDWEPIGKGGDKLANGSYTYSISAKGINNEDIKVDALTKVKITGVDVQDSEGAFFTDFGKIKLAIARTVGVEGYSDVASAEAAKDQGIPAVKPDQAPLPDPQ